MMNSLSGATVLIRNARISDPSSPYHRKRFDIFINNGRIEAIGKDLKDPFGCLVIDEKDVSISPGWMDLHTNVQDPGYEYKEDIDSALNCAARGGFTAILSCSTTDPPVDNKSTVEYQLKKAAGHLVDLHVSGTISRGAKGEELAEMYDMHKAGVRAFYDFKSPVINTQLLKLALLYTKPFNGLIMNFPKEKYLSENGVANEGVISTETGLQGMPAISEEIGLLRALKLAEYTNQRIHFSSLSTVAGIEVVKRARKSGIQVTTGVSIASLFFNEEVISKFDPNFKLDPPLREEKTRKALLKALLSGEIDVVISDHWPQNIERKECEYERAAFGMISLETTYSMLKSALMEKLDPDLTAEILAFRPRAILGLSIPTIKEEEPANITVFQPNKSFEYALASSASLSRNSPLNGRKLTGKVLASINNNQCQLNS